MDGLCHSIKSKKNSSAHCPSKATHGDFCAKHRKSKILWTSMNPKKTYIITRAQRVAINKIYNFWIFYGRRKIQKIHGPATFCPEIANNDTDISNLESLNTIPLIYRFSYVDDSKQIWAFDLRFLVQLMHYGNELKNPYTQTMLPPATVERFQRYTQILIRHKIPVLYTTDTTLSPEQIWNQKVLDVFLKLNSLGYAANLVWFENMALRHHHTFYTSLYNLWNYRLNLSHEQKESVVPAYDSGRSPLFRWTPEVITGHSQELKWWRKNNLSLMNTFLSRGKDRVVQSTGALYVLSALVTCSRGAAEAFPFLA
jgi:hypothetical protein